MQGTWKDNPFLKVLAVICAILFLWGTVLALFIVLMNMQLGFASTEQEFNTYFLELTEREQLNDVRQYARLILAWQQRNDQDSAMKENTLYYYQNKFDPNQTNFRFSVTDIDGELLKTNDDQYGGTAERLAENVRIESIAKQEQQYNVQKIFTDPRELMDAINNGTMPNLLTAPEDFNLWYFTDSDITAAYHNGVSVTKGENNQSTIRSFESLESAKEFDYQAEFGENAVWQYTAQKGEEGYNAAVWQRVEAELGEKAVQAAKVWAIAYTAGQDSETISFREYMTALSEGNAPILTDAKLAEKISKGIEVTVSGSQSISVNVCIRTYLPAGLPISDQIRANYAVFRLVYKYSEGIVIMLFAFMVLAVIACITMCTSAGHTRGKPGIFVSAVHKLPYEYFWVLPPAAMLLTMILMHEVFSVASVPYRIRAILSAGMILADAAAVVLFLYTTAVRIKSDSFWSSFGVVRFFNFIARIFKNRTLTCIALIAYLCGLFVLNVLAVMNRGLLMVAAGAADLLSIGGLIYCVYAYFELFNHVKRMQQGDFSQAEHSLPLVADFAVFDHSLGDITSHVGEMVAKQTKAEHLRTELITNVSHDLKTPLTSIVNYVDLLSREPMQTETAAEYLDVLRRQAARLKKLTIDLVDASKASTGNLTVELVPTNLQVLVEQIAGEYEEQLASRKLSMVMDVPEEPVSILADGRQIWRVFDNLLGNACKYAMMETRVYLDVIAGAENVVITLKNVSASPLNTSPDELMERFVRGDASRHTEGSGLGLSIARDLTRLQHGEMSLQTDGDLFKAVLVFPIYREEANQSE